MEKIKIKNKNYKVKYSLRSLFLYEQVTGKAFELNSTMDTFVFYYCMVLANNPDTKLTFDEFIDAFDDDPKLAAKFSQILVRQSEKQNMLGNQNEDGEDDGEKKN